MNRLDRYLLLQLLGPFGFFTLALAGILWLAQALPLVEVIIDNGRAGLIFLEFSSLIIPNVLIIVLPLSAFISTTYTLNRMFGDSEMVVVMSAGLSPSRIAKPTVVFGIFVMAAMYILIIFLQPVAITRLADGIDNLRRNAAASLLREKQFLHPMDGVTIYIRESSKAGEISGLFLHDQRDPNVSSTYSANQALLLQDESELRLVMSTGNLQRYDVHEKTLSTVDFDQFVFDLTELIERAHVRDRPPLEYKVEELLHPDKIIAAGGKRGESTYFAEAHNKIALPMLGFVLPLIATALLLSAKYRRSGFGSRITIIAFVGMLTMTFTLMIKNWVIINPSAYLLSYSPILIGIIVSALFLSYATNRGGRTKRANLRAEE